MCIKRCALRHHSIAVVWCGWSVMLPIFASFEELSIPQKCRDADICGSREKSLIILVSRSRLMFWNNWTDRVPESGGTRGFLYLSPPAWSRVKPLGFFSLVDDTDGSINADGAKNTGLSKLWPLQLRTNEYGISASAEFPLTSISPGGLRQERTSPGPCYGACGPTTTTTTKGQEDSRRDALSEGSNQALV